MLRRGRPIPVTLLLAATALACTGVAAHGDWPPKHGGQMNDGGETSFELVIRGREANLYVEDHGTAVPTRGAKGQLEVTRGEQRWATEIKAAGGNRLSSRLERRLIGGDAVLARVTFSNGSIAIGRFVAR